MLVLHAPRRRGRRDTPKRYCPVLVPSDASPSHPIPMRCSDLRRHIPAVISYVQGAIVDGELENSLNNQGFASPDVLETALFDGDGRTLGIRDESNIESRSVSPLVQASQRIVSSEGADESWARAMAAGMVPLKRGTVPATSSRASTVSATTTPSIMRTSNSSRCATTELKTIRGAFAHLGAITQ